MQKTITIEMPEDLLQPLVGLIDAGLRATGLRSAVHAAKLIEVLEASVMRAQPRSGTEDEPGK